MRLFSGDMFPEDVALQYVWSIPNPQVVDTVQEVVGNTSVAGDYVIQEAAESAHRCGVCMALAVDLDRTLSAVLVPPPPASNSASHQLLPQTNGALKADRCRSIALTVVQLLVSVTIPPPRYALRKTSAQAPSCHHPWALMQVKSTRASSLLSTLSPKMPYFALRSSLQSDVQHGQVYWVGSPCFHAFPA